MADLTLSRKSGLGSLRPVMRISTAAGLEASMSEETVSSLTSSYWLVMPALRTDRRTSRFFLVGGLNCGGADIFAFICEGVNKDFADGRVGNSFAGLDCAFADIGLGIFEGFGCDINNIGVVDVICRERLHRGGADIEVVIIECLINKSGYQFGMGIGEVGNKIHFFFGGFEGIEWFQISRLGQGRLFGLFGGNRRFGFFLVIGSRRTDFFGGRFGNSGCFIIRNGFSRSSDCILINFSSRRPNPGFAIRRSSSRSMPTMEAARTIYPVFLGQPTAKTTANASVTINPVLTAISNLNIRFIFYVP